ncbi:MAG: radical SAM protein [Candidatus Pacearchaeota archaeon]
MRFSKISSIYEVCSDNFFYYILRNNLTNQVLFINEKEFERIKSDIKDNKNTNEIKELKKAHIVVPDSYSEEKYIEYIREKYFLKEPEINIFYLTFNNECNLACKYCYVEGSYDNDKKSMSMSSEVFKDTMAFIENFILKLKEKNKLSPKLSFIYYGSEPLLNPDYVIKSIKHIDKLCKVVNTGREINIITNATQITPELVQFFKKYKVELAISLDGPEQINDEMRIFKGNKKGTHKKILESIEMLKKEKIPFGISCTIGPHNINVLKENISYFKKIGAGGVGFNTLLTAKNKEVPYLSINKSNDCLIEASDFANKNKLYEDRIQRKVKAFNRTEHPHFKDCGAIGNQLVFYPEGNIGVCQAYLGCKKPLVGNVSKDKENPLKILENKVLKRWSDRQPINISECKSCPAIGICGGGCAFNSEVKYGKLEKMDKTFCVHTQKILEWLLKTSIREKLNTEDVYIRDISFMFR